MLFRDVIRSLDVHGGIRVSILSNAALVENFVWARFRNVLFGAIEFETHDAHLQELLYTALPECARVRVREIHQRVILTIGRARLSGQTIVPGDTFVRHLSL